MASTVGMEMDGCRVTPETWSTVTAVKPRLHRNTAQRSAAGTGSGAARLRALRCFASRSDVNEA